MPPHDHSSHHKQAFTAAIAGNVAAFDLAAQGIQAAQQKYALQMQAVDAVVQIRTAHGGFGTGFVVDVIDRAYVPNLSDTTIVVMTNHHVIPDEATAKRAVAIAFNDDRTDRPDQRLEIRFSNMLYTSKPGPYHVLGQQGLNPLLDGYDFTVLQLRPGEAARLQGRGMTPLKFASPSEIDAFRRGFDRQLMSHPEVLVIQHPQGGQKKISSPRPKCYKYGDRTVTAIPFVQRELAKFPGTYEIAIATDNRGAEASQPGSSGSPILDAASLSVLGILWGGVTDASNLRFTFGTTFETISKVVDAQRQQAPPSSAPPPQLPPPQQLPPQTLFSPPQPPLPSQQVPPQNPFANYQTLQQQPQYSHAKTKSKSKSQGGYKGKGGYKSNTYPQQQSLPQQSHYPQSKAKSKYPLSPKYGQQKSLQQQPQQQPQNSHHHHPKTKGKGQGKGKGGHKPQGKSPFF